MIRYHSVIKNDKYTVCCTGRRVFVFDPDGKKIACFGGLSFAYFPAFSPDGRTLAVKSTEGIFSVYSLDTMTLVKRFVISGVRPQYGGFCFSRDGGELYVVCQISDRPESRILVYETKGYTLTRTLLSNDGVHTVSYIEYDKEYDGIYVIGTMKDEEGLFTRGFVAELMLDCLRQITEIDEFEYEAYCGVCYSRLTGFTSWDKTLFNCTDGKEIEAIDFTLPKLLYSKF